MCAVALTPRGAGVRVREVMSRGRGPRGGPRREDAEVGYSLSGFGRLVLHHGQRTRGGRRLHRAIDQARAILADVHNWFVEGFDAADLKDAKALLEELDA